MKPTNKRFVELPGDIAIRDRTDDASFALKPSEAGGVGIIALHGIQKGAHLELFADGDARFVPHAEVSTPALRQLCDRFGVETTDGVWVPLTFNRMSIGWYLNHSDTPNAFHDDEYEYYAARDIQAGEEITINYSSL